MMPATPPSDTPDTPQCCDVRDGLALHDSLLAIGAVNSLIGTLTSRTLMFAELEVLLTADTSGDLETHRQLVVDENVCAKNSSSTRLKTFRHLRELYALDENVPLFRIWKQLWSAAPAERPLLALVLAATREPLLRATAPVIINALPGAIITPGDLETAVETVLPGNYRAATQARLGRNCASAWAQSGHLSGKLTKRRAKAIAGPATVSLALLLGYLGEARGLALFETLWVQLLDIGSVQIDQFAFAASSRGWIDYRRIGDVVDVGFSAWMPYIEK